MIFGASSTTAPLHWSSVHRTPEPSISHSPAMNARLIKHVFFTEFKLCIHEQVLSPARTFSGRVHYLLSANESHIPLVSLHGPRSLKTYLLACWSCRIQMMMPEANFDYIKTMSSCTFLKKTQTSRDPVKSLIELQLTMKIFSWWIISTGMTIS
jgi:hypothetical protein